MQEQMLELLESLEDHYEDGVCVIVRLKKIKFGTLERVSPWLLQTMD